MGLWKLQKIKDTQIKFYVSADSWNKKLYILNQFIVKIPKSISIDIVGEVLKNKIKNLSKGKNVEVNF